MDKHICKIAIIGPASSGKTSFFEYYIYNIEPERSYRRTNTVKYGERNSLVHSMPVNVKIWDIPGAELTNMYNSFYYKLCDVVLLVFDITNNKSFDMVPYWISNVKKYYADKPVILLANKVDISKEHIIDEAKLRTYSNEHGFATCFMISTQSKTDIHNVIEYVVSHYSSEIVTNNITSNKSNKNNKCIVM